MDEINNVTHLNPAVKSEVGTDGAIMDMLPAQYRAAIMGQYIESQAMKHDAQAFVKALENRLLTTAVTSTFNVIKELVNTPTQ